MRNSYRIILVATMAILMLSIHALADDITLRLALREDVQTVAIYEQIIADFEAENPGVKVEIFNTSSTEFNESVMIQIAAGIPPDVLYVHYTFFPELARLGFLLDVSPYIEADNYDLDDFFPPTLEQLRWQGQLGLALPRETSSPAIFYNINLFDQRGLPHPEAGWTYDEMVETARMLTADFDGDGETDQWGLYGMTHWFHRPNYIWAFGGEILSEDGMTFRLHEPEGERAIQWLADLHAVEGIATFNWANRFATGASAMEVVNFWQIIGNLQNDFEWDAVELPVGPVANVTRNATGGHGILRHTQHPDEAWELLKFLSSTESLLRLSQSGTIIPARHSAATDPGFLQGKPANRMAFIDAILPGRPDNIPLAVNDVMDAAFGPVWLGEKSARAALEEIRPQINQILKELYE